MFGIQRGEARSTPWSTASFRWSQDFSKASLRLIPSFLAKTKLAESERLSFSISARSSSLDVSLEKDVRLCPLRALRLYLGRTRNLRVKRETLVLFSLEKFP